jgi:enterochelin esterase-like enzyme
MKRPVFAMILCGIVAASATASAQQAPNVISPEVHADGRVTFRFWAPRAQEVRVTAMENQHPVAMTRGEQGLWTATLGPLEPNIYSYAYEVDGAPTIDPRNPAVKVWLQLNSMVEVPGTPPRLHEVQDVPHGTVVLHTYRSKALNQTRQVFVYTPPGYHTGTAPASGCLPAPRLRRRRLGVDRRGTSARHRRQPDRAEADRADAHRDALRPQPLAADAAPPDREDNDAAVERDLLDDVLPLVESAYRVARDPERRAIVGLSMGGGQALKTGLRHLDTFRWVGAFSAAAPQGDPSVHFPTLKADAAAKLRLLWIGIGKDDFLLQRNEEFNTWLKEQGFPYTYTVTAGAHDWIVWRRYLAEFLPLLFTRR